ncbi:MAG TPA: hypothetical protein VKZ96_04095, partial [Thermomicrobiales bacterium]|nr:hypothetical protein [Thermomicrobiales bacterium]
MRDCVIASADQAPINVRKRMRYVKGMVLGPAEFGQDQAHFEWKHRISNELLHGYGTVCGLQVTSRATEDGGDREIVIGAGYAISPRGNWIWVDPEQCALLGEWVAAHREEREDFVVPGNNSVYVALCYDECPTDLTHIAARACASEDETRAHSRITEMFRAEFRWEPPPQEAEEAARAFGALLRAVEIAVGTDDDDSEAFLEAVRAIGLDDSGATPDVFNLPEASACEVIRTALLIWATEICPRFHLEAEQDCILLAQLHFDVDDAGAIDFDTLMIDEGA